MNLRKYEAFACVVSLQSLTRAAQTLGCTQSAVSHMIRSLEEELGYRLLVRNRQGVKLTAAGKQTLPAVLAVLRANEQLEQIISGIRGHDIGTVRIAAFTSVAVHWLPDILKQFQLLHPKVEFQLNNGDYHDVEQWLRDEACDIGFISLPTNLQLPYFTLTEDPLVAIVSTNHPLAGASHYPVRRVEQEDFISLLETSSHDTRRIFHENSVTPNIKFTTKDDYAIIAMVEKGLGISILPQLLLQDCRESIAVLPLDPPCRRTIALALSKTGTDNPVAQTFAQYVQTWVQTHA